METRLGPTEPSEILDAIIGAIHHELGVMDFPLTPRQGFCVFTSRSEKLESNQHDGRAPACRRLDAAYSAIDPAQR